MDPTQLGSLAGCIAARWSPGIGDPTAMGWLTVAAYAAAGMLCLRAGSVRKRDRRFWMALGALLLALMVNKQLDLQSALTATGRCIAQIQGWYDSRRMVQAIFIVFLLGFSVGLFGLALKKMKRSLHRTGLALAGFALLLCFVAIRAVGFHHMDALINSSAGPMRLNWLFELTGIALIGVNAFYGILGRRRSEGSAIMERRDLPFSRPR